MNKLVLFVFMVYAVNIAIPQMLLPDSYHWRDYKNIPPEDPLVVGPSLYKGDMYVGQVMNGEDLVEGTLYEHDNRIHIEVDGKQSIKTDHIKVLCTEYPELFKWIPTTSNLLVTLTNKLLLVGGFEKNLYTYIGRTTSGDAIIIGKVICPSQNCTGMIGIIDGQVKTFHKFDVLTYDMPNDNETDIDNGNPDDDYDVLY